MMLFSIISFSQQLKLENNTNCDIMVNLVYSEIDGETCPNEAAGSKTYVIAAGTTSIVTPPSGMVFVFAKYNFTNYIQDDCGAGQGESKIDCWCDHPLFSSWNTASTIDDCGSCVSALSHLICGDEVNPTVLRFDQ